MKTNPIISTMFLCLTVGLPAFSQTTTTPIAIPLGKGSYFVGLNAGGGYGGGDGKLTILNLTAQGGIFAAKQLVTGFQISYNTFNIQIKDSSRIVSSPSGINADLTIRSFSPELFARYYPFQSRFRPILLVSAGGVFQSRDRTSFSDAKSNDKSSGFTAAGLGLGWFVAKRMSVELLYQIRTQPPVITRGSSELRLGVSIFLK